MLREAAINLISMRKFVSIFCLCLLSLTGWTQKDYVPAPENLKARKEFQDNKFGVFLHWGLYSMLAQGEWVMRSEEHTSEL